MKNNNNTFEFQKASSEVFLEAIDFFSKGGVKFINKKNDHRYSISILIDDSIKSPVIITPFSFAMNKNSLAGLYCSLLKGERFGGGRRIQILLRIMNDIIREGYKRGSLLSHNIETGKYVFTASTTLMIFGKIFVRGLEYSLGGDHLEHLGDIYSLLGGELGTRKFLKECFLATERSIPEFNESPTVVGHIPDIRCYTCKYCRVDENGIRTCSKAPMAITGLQYEAHPGRYPDAHHSDDTDTLVSAVIDERMDTCCDYVSRIR